MKKTFIFAIIFILIGIVFGNNLYKLNYTSIINSINSNNKYYFLQEGIYSTKDNLKDATKNLEHKMVEEIDNKYYVYIGITKDKEVANKIENIYKNKGINIYQKEKEINNEEFYNNVTQFDILIKNSTKDEEILTIEEVVLANYEEIIKND